jgi:hypothetical protein
MTELFEDLPSVDPAVDYLTELVGEGKKFKTPQELALGKAEADAFIERLKLETQELRNELSTRVKYEEFLDKLNSAQLSNSQQPSGDDQQQQKPAMSPEEIARLVATQINQTEAQKTAQQNLALVENRLREALGPNFASKLRQQAAELGLSDQEVKNLAETKPKALFRLLGLDSDRPNEQFAPPPKTQVTGFAPTGQKRGKSYYDEIYKTDPTRYYSPEIYNERYNLIKEIGIEAYNKL